jgi:hypothetical protein
MHMIAHKSLNLIPTLIIFFVKRLVIGMFVTGKLVASDFGVLFQYQHG